uniref:Cryptochrome 5 transcript variant X2 n=1 Tax=Garra andruzzii TaxID=472297 RepID=A0A3G2JS09_9TELE|nr:cryptochrome 5 transcript variant X2 [Garra andruzzii]
MSHNSIHWFRKGLRLHDNPALLAALKDCRHIYPRSCWTPGTPTTLTSALTDGDF